MDRKNPKIASLEHLLKPIKDGLELIRDLVVEKFNPEMIILFGSLTTAKRILRVPMMSCLGET